MKYLLDTCTISELIKSTPNQNVIHWIKSSEERRFFLSVLTIGEIQKGISKLSESSRKEMLQEWIEHELADRFEGRILPINEQVARIWGEIQGEREKNGIKLPAIDSLIAATAIAHELTVVTRNVKDFELIGVPVISPWVG